MTQSIELPWGENLLKLNLPKNWRVLGELKPEKSRDTVNPLEACSNAMADPIGTQRLCSRNLAETKILIVVDDHSRPTPVADFLPAIIGELLSGGARKDNIQFLIGTGVHRADTPNEVARKLGQEVMVAYRWSCHDAYDLSGLENVGTTSRGTKVYLNKKLLEADLIVCAGAIEPHLLLGFGGGYKMILPGCAGVETIAKNHMQGVDPEHFNYVGTLGDHSPMRKDLEEAAQFLNREIFIVNAAINENAKPSRFFAGDPVLAHRMGESFVEKTLSLKVPEQADVVIANSRPMDADLRQSVKCIGNTLYASKPGGVMIGMARAINGLGEMPLAKKTLPYVATRTILKVIGKNRVLPLVEKVKKDEPVEEIFISHLALQMLRRNNLAIFSDSTLLPPDIGRKMGMARSFTDVKTLMNWASSRVPSAATVWVFPYGGATYATI